MYYKKISRLKKLMRKLKYATIGNHYLYNKKKIYKNIREIQRLVAQLRRLKTYDTVKIVGAACVILASFSSSVKAQTFAPVQNSPFNLQSTGFGGTVGGCDLDSDGDIDLLAGEYNTPTYYFENGGTSSSPAFNAPQTGQFGIAGNSDNVDKFEFVDIDNDGDFDIFSQHSGAYNEFGYYENTGSNTSPSFAASVSNPFGLSTIQCYDFECAFADIDNDGDFDVFAKERVYGTKGLMYFENIGSASSPSFATGVSNPFNIDLNSINIPGGPDLGDLDNDGDLDIMLGDYYGAFFYFENTGTVNSPNFSAPTSNPFGLTTTGGHSSPFIVDIDGDGDLDVFSGSTNGIIKFYENTSSGGATDISELSKKAINIYPNPNKGIFTIDILGESSFSFEIIDLLGRSVILSGIGLNSSQSVDVSQLPAGTYTVKLLIKNKVEHKTLVLTR